MDKNLTFGECYSLMDVTGLIIIEDTLQFDVSRTAILYDYMKLPNEERDLFLRNIIEGPTKTKLIDVSRTYEGNKRLIIWDEVPQRDIESYIKKKELTQIIEVVERIKTEDIHSIEAIAKRFGLGIKSQAVSEYSSMLKDIYSNDLRLPLRIYNDFSAEDKAFLLQDIVEFGKNEKFFFCIIDDFLGTAPRGNEIIDWLNEIQAAKDTAACILLSSREREQLGINNGKMYIEYVSKAQADLDECIKRALIKSQYGIMLHALKKKRIMALEEAYGYALKNLNVAVHLSAMAKEEGTTNYEVITNWLDLREAYKWQMECKAELKTAILLSSMLSMLIDDRYETVCESESVKEIQVFEEYDYMVNGMNTPPMVGDVFYIKGDYYLLIGQECDLSIRNGKRNTPLAELLKIDKISNRDMGNFKERYGFEKIVLANFKDINDVISNIVIDCTKRHVIDNEVLDLCIFNQDGKARIDLAKDLTLEQKCQIPLNWEEYYIDIKKRMLKLLEISKKIIEYKAEIEFDLSEILDSMGASHNERLVSIVDYTSEDSKIQYEVTRVCRIKNHILLANKLHLEYRGRQAFDTINMDVGKTALYTLKIEALGVEKDGKTAVIVLTNKRADNCEDKYKSRDWIIKKNDIIDCISLIPGDDATKYVEMLSGDDEDIILRGRTGRLSNQNISYTKLSKDGTLVLKLTF